MNPTPVIKMLGRKLLFASPTNPRTKFDPEKLAELRESVKLKGIKSPLLVRPVDDKFEIVAGERRYRASEMLEELPCIVEEMSDSDVLELQLIENLQRDDLEPLEEAEAYHRMLTLDGDGGAKKYTVAQLAERIGKSTAYVRKRLKLRDIPSKMRKALEADKIGANVASLVARIPDKSAREKAAQEILDGYDGTPLSQREAMSHIREGYMVELKGAPFDQNDATLVPVVFADANKTERCMGGSCEDCPLRTGNNRELFGDESRGDICTMPKCYGLKKEAQWHRSQEQAKVDGKKLIPEKEAQSIFYYGQEQIAYNSKYIDLDKQPECDLLGSGNQKGVPTWRKLIDGGPCKVQIYVVRTPKGKIWELAERVQVIEAAKKNGHEALFTKASGSRAQKNPAAAKERERQRLAAEQMREGFLAMFSALGDRREIGTDLWMVLLKIAMKYHASADGSKVLLKSLDLEIKKEGYSTDCVSPMMKFAENYAKIPAKIFALTVLALIAERMRWSGVESDSFKDLAKVVGLDVEALKKRVAAEMEAKRKAAEPLYITPHKGKGAAVITWDKKARVLKVKEQKDSIEISLRTSFSLGWNDALQNMPPRDLGQWKMEGDEKYRSAYNEGKRQGTEALNHADARPDFAKMEKLFDAPKNEGRIEKVQDAVDKKTGKPAAKAASKKTAAAPKVDANKVVMMKAAQTGVTTITTKSIKAAVKKVAKKGGK